MAPRATWKGQIRLAELTVPVALYAASTTAQRMAFHILNRKTGNRVNREFVDESTDKPVDSDAQVKGYETGDGEYIILDPEEIAAVVPESDKTIRIESFIPCREVDTLYFDRPYLLAPTDRAVSEAFELLRQGLEKQKVAALGRAVLFRRVRTVLLRAREGTLLAHTLNFDYEVRSAEEAFDDLPDLKIEGEMLDLAKHIIGTKAGSFDPGTFDDRYDQALAELVKAKMEGREIKRPAKPKETKVASLLDALRLSAKGGKAAAAAKPAARKSAPRKAAAPTRKAG